MDALRSLYQWSPMPFLIGGHLLGALLVWQLLRVVTRRPHPFWPFLLLAVVAYFLEAFVDLNRHFHP